MTERKDDGRCVGDRNDDGLFNGCCGDVAERKDDAFCGWFGDMVMDRVDD